MRDLAADKKRACVLASKLLQSNERYLERVIELWKIGNSLYGQVWGTEFHIFGVIESDTDHLPTNKVRELCSNEWQAKSDKELEGCISFYKEEVSIGCNEILSKYSNAYKALKPTCLRGICIVHSLRSLSHNTNTATAVGLALRYTS